MATACWAFIVAKSTPVETASLLGFCGVARFQRENSSTSYAQAVVHRLWTSWRPAEVTRNTAPTQRFRPRLYRFGGVGRGQMLAKWVRAHVSRIGAGSTLRPRLFARRTRFLPGEKTHRPTRLSGHCWIANAGTCNRCVESDAPHADNRARSDGAAGRNRTCDPLLRREMLYPLSYSRTRRAV